MRFETVVSPPTFGAGRVISFGFPEIGAGTNVNNLPNNNGGLVSQRPMLTTTIIGTGAVGGLLATVGVPPAPNGLTTYLGRMCWAFTSDGATGRNIVCNTAGSAAWSMPFATVKGGQPAGLDDMGVWECAAILAFDQVPGAITGDIGFGIGISTRSQIRGPAQHAGIEVGPRNIGSIGIVARQTDGGAVTIDQALTVQPGDITKFNKYSIRVISATKTSEAQLKVLVNGVMAFTANWGAGTLLPEQALAAGGMGMMPFLINLKAHANTTRMYVPNCGVTVSAAPTELALQ